MKAKVFINSKVGNLFAATGILAGMLLPAAFPMLASAATLDSRSVAMSASTANAPGVTYTFSFTPSDDYQGILVDFCDADSGPIPGQACDAPTGFDISSAATSSNVTFSTGGVGTLTTTASTASHLSIVGSTPQDTSSEGDVVFTVEGVHNPTDAGSFYARIYTYATDTDSATYTDVTNLGTTLDTGGIALAATSDVSVSAAVRETLTFCVAGDHGTLNTGTAYISADCGDFADNPPNVTLGHGTPAALDAGHTDTADVYSQISTNAASGAIVSMKNGNLCGGLSRDNGATCDIAASGSGNAISAGTSMFGMKLGTTSVTTGTVDPLAPYNTANYGMTYSTSGTGVASTYGDPIYNTDGHPVNNANVPMTFAASASNTTPAGLYKANLSLVATGTF